MRKTVAALAVAGAAGALVISACSSTPSASKTSSGSSSGNQAAASGQALTTESFKIGFDLPETTTARYETKDRPYFTAALKQFCPNCTLLYGNANSSASTQQQQAQSMLAEGANALVIDPFDGVAAASIVSAARAQQVPVVAYDRLIQSPQLSYVVSNDYQQVGKLQGTAFVNALKTQGASASSGGILMINGADTDNNAHNIKAGALSAIGPSGYKTLASVDTWDPDQARQWVASQITRFGHHITGIYSANDTNASSAISALKAAGWSNAQIQKLDLTGLDASVQGLQNIVAGLQLMTTYNAFKLEATKAAAAAVELALGKTPASNGTVSGIKAYLNPPQTVTTHNIMSTVIKDGFWKVSDICTSQYAAACQKASI